MAKINNFLGLLDSTNEGTGYSDPIEHKGHLTDAMGLETTTKLNNSRLFLQEWNVDIDVMVDRHSVKDDIA